MGEGGRVGGGEDAGGNELLGGGDGLGRSQRRQSGDDGQGRAVALRCRLGHELPPTSYTDPKGRAKVVRYWMMEPLDGEFAPSGEVDEMRWILAREAHGVLSYAHDRELLREVTG